MLLNFSQDLLQYSHICWELWAESKNDRHKKMENNCWRLEWDAEERECSLRSIRAVIGRENARAKSVFLWILCAWSYKGHFAATRAIDMGFSLLKEGWSIFKNQNSMTFFCHVRGKKSLEKATHDTEVDQLRARSWEKCQNKMLQRARTQLTVSIF